MKEGGALDPKTADCISFAFGPTGKVRSSSLEAGPEGFSGILAFNLALFYFKAISVDTKDFRIMDPPL